MNSTKAVFVLSAVVLLLGFPVPTGASITLGDLTITRIGPRIVTPNGDGFNDRTRFVFDNPQMLPVSGTIYDISGARVADMQGGPDATSALVWDGKDGDGRVVSGGIYLYQIEYQGKRATGTVVVAR
jgi:hypothetical protein